MMQMPRLRVLRAGLLTGAAFAGLASPAFALDGTDFISKLNAAYAMNGASIAYDAIDVGNDTVSLKGTKIKVANAGTGDLHIGDVNFDGVEELADGGYTVETVHFADVDQNKDNKRFTAKDMTIGGLQIPAKVGTGTLNDILFYETASTGPITLTEGAKTLFSIEKTESNMTRQDGDKGVEFDAIISGVKADLSDVQDAKTRQAIDKLGLKTINGEMTMEGSWELGSGDISIDEYAMNVDKVGRLSLALDISGYTMQFVKSMQDAFKAAEANPDKDAANQALGLSAMGLMQQLSFNSASIRFDDASITKRLLDYFGAEQGVTGEQFAQSIKGLTPLMMAQLNVPELQNQVTTAVNTFLDAPKNLTISAEPKNPVPFPMIAGAGMGAPNTLPGVLGVTVTANE